MTTGATHHPDAVGLLQDLVRIDSPSGEEQAIADHLEEVFHSLGWQAHRTGRNLHALVGQQGPLLLLASHTDTVPAGEGWTRPPLGARIAEGKIYGRGSNDAKGCLTAMILATARVFEHPPPTGRVCLAATCEEEVMGQGLETLLPKLEPPDAAVVGEPTGLHPAVAQKGLVVLELTAMGRSGHVAWGEGTNAIRIAADDIQALFSLDFEREHPFLGRPSLQVSQIQGGVRANVIPDRCWFVVDIRTTPAYSAEEIIDLVGRKVKSRVQVRSKRLTPVSTPIDHAVVQAALRANPESVLFGSPTLSDWVFLKDIPAVKVGPGDSRRSHTPDEYLEVEELYAGVDFYERMIRSYFDSVRGDP